jgi:hypothetical protein
VLHTVMRVPLISVCKCSVSSRICMIGLTSPKRATNGVNPMAERRFAYHAKWIAEPSTWGREVLIAVECRAVVNDDSIPKTIPLLEFVYVSSASTRAPHPHSR